MRAGLLLFLYLVSIPAAAFVSAWLGRRAPARVIAGFALLPLAFVFSGFFRGETILPVDHARLIDPWNSDRPGAVRYNPNLNDAITQFAPWAKAVRMAWKEGSLPLRDRWNGCGTALAANGQSAAFAPWTILLFFAPLASSFNVLVAWKLHVALWGTWLWLKELGLRDVSAAFGAIAFALSFTMTPWLLFPQTSALMLVPWILFVAERLRAPERRLRAFAALIVLFAVWPLAGHAETVASFSLFVVLWLAARAACGDFPRDRTVWRPLAAAALLAIGLSAFAVLPQVFAIQASQRLAVARHPAWSHLFSWRPHGPVWPGLWVTLFPRSLGDSIGTPMLPGAPGSFAEVGLAHVGTVAAACILLFFRPGSARARSSWVLLALGGFGLFAGVGLWPFFELTSVIPALRMMVPFRWLSWAALAGAGLAAFELDRWITDRDRAPGAAGWLAGCFALLIALATFWFLWNRPAYGTTEALTAYERAFAVSVLVAGAGLIVSAASLTGARARTVLPVLLTAVLAAELFWQGRRLYRFGAPEDLFRPTPLVAFLRSRPAAFRVIGEGAVLFPSSNVFAGLEDVRTHDPVERADYLRFLDACCGYDPSPYFKRLRDVNSPALDFLNVRYLVSVPGRNAPASKWTLVYAGRDGTVFENRQVRPRAFVVPEGSGVEIARYEERTNRARVQLRASAGHPVSIQTSLVDDGGWTVRCGSGGILEKTSSRPPFLSFELPAGETEALLAYLPPGFRSGGAISASAAVAVLLWAMTRRRTRRPGNRRARPAVSDPARRRP